MYARLDCVGTLRLQHSTSNSAREREGKDENVSYIPPPHTLHTSERSAISPPRYQFIVPATVRRTALCGDCDSSLKQLHRIIDFSFSALQVSSGGHHHTSVATNHNCARYWRPSSARGRYLPPVHCSLSESFRFIFLLALIKVTIILLYPPSYYLTLLRSTVFRTMHRAKHAVHVATLLR